MIASIRANSAPVVASGVGGRPVLPLLLWFALALGLGGRLAHLPLFAPQACAFLLVAALVIGYRGSARFRSSVQAVDLRLLVAVHLARFVGFYFLFLYGRGKLPWEFAVPGGLGDIAVATLALVMLAVLWMNGGPSGRRLLVAWNLLGLVDILLVVATAARLSLARPGSMHALTTLPLSLLPTFLVPLIIGSHLAMLARLRREA